MLTKKDAKEDEDYALCLKKNEKVMARGSSSSYRFLRSLAGRKMRTLKTRLKKEPSEKRRFGLLFALYLLSIRNAAVVEVATIDSCTIGSTKYDQFIVMG